MLLTSANGDYFGLTVVDYQFEMRSAAAANGWDESWLTISGRVSCGTESWAFRDPCLTTWEAEELLKWLRGIATRTLPGQIDFTEPNLSFDARAGENELATLLVTLRAEAASPSTPEHIRWGAGCEVALDMSLDAIEHAASAWADEISVYPLR